MFVNGIFKKRRNAGTREPNLPLPPPAKRIKREPSDEGYLAAMALANEMNGTTSSLHQISTDESTTDSEAVDNEIMRADFNWNAIFHQDIEVSGVKIKTEDLIDTQEELENQVEEIASPITALSPPPSDSNSDVGLEDLLNPDFGTDLDGPLDLSTGDALDLTITGSLIKPPNWWAESINGRMGFQSPEHTNSGLNTPVTCNSPTPDHEHSSVHPWAENRTALDEAIASFDLDLQNLFEDDLTGPNLGDS